ncbi:eukaryotic translation initiation factor 2-alpha kinase 1-like [Saccoglossus kowalevskii]|uniref:Eukaryotic translation initiation factor 2-alpha kinase 1 n=1 Tax=Saccoglossus kowalevskii TaxID=10224 RepID=A0ABM0MN87_SACKO|nr:PREDICTED: eukaryotic translation initiation factor 2-alpha kinase 1-like [Saccoglossus kowalevskii]
MSGPEVVVFTLNSFSLDVISLTQTCVSRQSTMFNKQNIPTNSKFKRTVPTTLGMFDDSDLNKVHSTPSPPRQKLLRRRGEVVQKLNLARRTVPDHLLVVSLIEQLCSLYEADNRRSRKLFKFICDQLTIMEILPPLYHLDEFSRMRAQYKMALSNIMKVAVATFPKDPRHIVLPSSLPERAMMLFENSNPVDAHIHVDREGLFNAFVSRYNEEFVELVQLGKGGFGSVYKVKNKLDGREYAVKKIKLKDNNPDMCLKILREVRLLASMHHGCIVGYNAAWLERISHRKILRSHSHSPHALPALENHSDSHTSSDGIIFERGSQHSTVFISTCEEKFDSSHEQIINNRGSIDSSDLSTKPEMCNSEDSFETPVNSPSVTSVFHSAMASRVDTVKLESSAVECTSYAKSIHIIDSAQLSTQACEAIISETRIHIKNTNDITEYCCHGDVERDANSMQDCKTTDCVVNDIITGRPMNRHNIERHVHYGNCTDSGSMHDSCSWEPESCDHYPQHKNEGYYSDDGVNYDGTVSEFNQLKYGIMLFIQMQLCSHTLREWLVERNTSVSPTADPFSVVNEETNMGIFKQILEGVNYIHSQGLMHRDLKPRNIFLEKADNCIRIGDFGLAREGVIDVEVPLTPLHQGVYSTDSSHTSGVGTCTYASPEQLKGSFYDNKSDMYSLGIILFELFHPFGTEMERFKHLTAIREGDIPPILKEQWPHVCDVIERLLSRDSRARPSAKEILHSELYRSKDEIIEELHQLLSEKDSKLMEKEKELTELKRELRKKDEMIQKLQEMKLK